MNHKIVGNISRVLKFALIAVGCIYGCLYLLIVYNRIAYPYELEWMEGSVVDHVARVLAGQKLYVSPTIEFIPFQYTPLYFYLSAAVSKIVGPGFLPLRLVSFLSSIGCFSIIYIIVRRMTQDTFSAFLSCSLFAAAFKATGSWLDIARCDSLFLFLLLAGIYVLRFKTSSLWHVSAGLLISLSFLTKQTALVVSPFLFVYSFVTYSRRSLWFIGTTIVVMVGSTLFLDLIHDGWYSYYVFDLQNRPPMFSKVVSFWNEVFVPPLGISLVAALSLIAYLIVQIKNNEAMFLSLTFLAMVGASFLSWVQAGAYNNCLLPGFAVLSIIFGVAVDTSLRLSKKMPLFRSRIMEIAVYVGCILQFGSFLYDPRSEVPTGRDVKAGAHFVETMSSQKGELMVPSHGFLPTLAGNRSHAHLMAVSDLMKIGKSTVRENLFQETVQALRERRFSMVIIDSSASGYPTWFPRELSKYYVVAGELFDDPFVFWPVTGNRTRPQFLFVRSDTSLQQGSHQPLHAN
jgi:hypothetical protein